MEMMMMMYVGSMVLHWIWWLSLVGIGISLFFVAMVNLHWWLERRAGLCKGPRTWPFIGAVLTHGGSLPFFHDYITHYCKLYTTFRVAFPGFDCFYTVDPTTAEHMLKSNFNNYVKGKYTYDKHYEFLGDGIFSVDGAEWKQQRKIASYEFASKTLKDFCELAFRENAIKLANFLSLESQDGRIVDMQDVFLRLTFESYSKLGFGLDMSTLQRNPPPRERAFVNAFDCCNSMVFSRYVDPLWKLKRMLRVGNEAKFAEAVATLDSMVFSFIKERRKELLQSKDDIKPCIERSDLLTKFLMLGKSNPEEFTEKKIRDLILNFMLAGRDTTAVTLSWFLFALYENPCVQDKLVEELCQVGAGEVCDVGARYPSVEEIQGFAKHLSYDKLSQLHYLQACLQETLRLYPPLPHDLRVAVKDDVLPDGIKVKKGDCLNISPYAMGRMDWLWGKDCLDFKPERFIKEGICQLESPFKLTAFLAGPRTCLGKDFAMLQMKVTAAILIRFFKFEVVPGYKVQYKTMLTLHMAGEGLKMNILPRHHDSVN